MNSSINSLIIYQDGKKTEIKAVNESYKGVIEQCEDLFFAADDTYRLTVTSQLIKEMKQKSAIEIIYSKVQKTETPKPIYFTRLLIPLQSKLKDGTVFYSGITEIEYNKKFPDLQIEKAYKQIDEYRSFNVFVNTKGLTDLKKASESFLK